MKFQPQICNQINAFGLNMDYLKKNIYFVLIICHYHVKFQKNPWCGFKDIQQSIKVYRPTHTQTERPMTISLST